MVYPMAAMVFLTFFVGAYVLKLRFASVKSGKVRARYFKLMEGQEVPDIIIQSTRNFNNMFEVPVLFYVACLAYMTLNLVSELSIIFAWSFVSFRVIHAYIHLTYNHVLHRLIAFWFGIMAVMALWVNIIIQTL
jgi:hypothetical protein